jgi:hypothetical protein
MSSPRSPSGDPLPSQRSWWWRRISTSSGRKRPRRTTSSSIIGWSVSQSRWLSRLPATVVSARPDSCSRAAERTSSASPSGRPSFFTSASAKAAIRLEWPSPAGSKPSIARAMATTICGPASTIAESSERGSSMKARESSFADAEQSRPERLAK